MMGITLDTLYNHYAKYIDKSYQMVNRSINLYQNAKSLHLGLHSEKLGGIEKSESA